MYVLVHASRFAGILCYLILTIDINVFTDGCSFVGERKPVYVCKACISQLTLIGFKKP